jgi:hypothetical protein
MFMKGMCRVNYTDASRRRFQSAVLVCILLRKNFWSSIPVHSFTKIPLVTVRRRGIC